MSHRQVILDTETTGMPVSEGHRIIEIGCVELIDRKFTGREFHYYLNPQREVDAGAFAVHGLSTDFLQDKPLFSKIADELMLFLSGAELIIHNAAFDLGFLNYEFSLTRPGFTVLTDHCNVIDTLQLARQLHAGQRNSLDALCKRYFIDNSKRDLHGALLDSHLLAQVYLAMTGGQGDFFDSLSEKSANSAEQMASFEQEVFHAQDLLVIAANSDEIAAHETYLQSLQKKGKCLWPSSS